MITVCSRIVVPFDNSELSKKALETAVTLAKQDKQIELMVVTVVETARFLTIYGGLQNDSFRDEQLAQAKAMLDKAEIELQTLPNKLTTYVLEGRPANKIVEFAKANDADLIVMGSRGLSGIKEMYLGSVSHHVVQLSTCPVYVVK